MKIRVRRVEVDTSKCRRCSFCRTVSICHSPTECVGCLACYWACPYEARYVTCLTKDVERINIRVDGVEYEVPNGITVAEALRFVGFEFSKPGSEGVSLSCETGGCWSCAVLIDDHLERSCITPVKDGMVISTDIDGLEPMRIVHGPEPHRVGGKATPGLKSITHHTSRRPYGSPDVTLDVRNVKTTA